MFDSDIPWALAPSEFPDSRFSNCIIGCPHVGKRWVVSIDVGDPSMRAAMEIIRVRNGFGRRYYDQSSLFFSVDYHSQLLLLC